MPTDNDIRTAARGLRSQGLTFKAIGQQIGVSRNTARRWTLGLHGRNERPEPERTASNKTGAQSYPYCHLRGRQFGPRPALGAQFRRQPQPP